MENKLAKSLANLTDLNPDKNRSFKVRDLICGGLDLSPLKRNGFDTRAISTFMTGGIMSLQSGSDNRKIAISRQN
jgi:hypothetical protein